MTTHIQEFKQRNLPPINLFQEMLHDGSERISLEQDDLSNQQLRNAVIITVDALPEFITELQRLQHYLHG